MGLHERQQFVAEYLAIVRKYRVWVSACTCCSGVFIDEQETGERTDWVQHDLDEHIAHIQKIDLD